MKKFYDGIGEGHLFAKTEFPLDEFSPLKIEIENFKSFSRLGSCFWGFEVLKSFGGVGMGHLLAQIKNSKNVWISKSEP